MLYRYHRSTIPKMRRPLDSQLSFPKGIIMYRPYGKDVEHKEYFDAFEKLMTQLGGRPHWAKNHGWTAADCSRAYPKFAKFMELRQQVDPEKVFWNDYLERVLSEPV